MLVVQCLLFGDGGVTALGANVLNMAVIGSIGGYWIYAGLRKWLGGPRGTVIAAVVASWLIIPISALAFAVEMSAGGQVAFRPIATWMLFYHVLIGLGEAVVTGLVTAWLLRVRPDLIYDAEALEQGPHRWGRVMAAGLTLGIAIAVFAAPLPANSATVWKRSRPGCTLSIERAKSALLHFPITNADGRIRNRASQIRHDWSRRPR